jgi:hypothetical protein
MTLELAAPTDVDRLRALVAELDRLLAAGPSQLAAVNPDGTPGHVAANELIESAWGNAVVDTIERRPKGWLAAGFSNTNHTGIQGTPVVLSGTTVNYTVTGTASRHVRITAQVTLFKGAADTAAQCALYLSGDGGAEMSQAGTWVNQNASSTTSMEADVVVAPGAHTTYVQAATAASFVNAGYRKVLVVDLGAV